MTPRLLTNQANNLNNNFGIAGAFNHNGNDGTISRFGWKAQNKSLHIFAGEAYNVEMGVTQRAVHPRSPAARGRRQWRHWPHGSAVELPESYRNRVSGRHIQPNINAAGSGFG